MKTCIDCGEEFDQLYEDAARPPLDEGECLCKDCWAVTAQNHIDELMTEKAYIAEKADKLKVELELY